MAVMGALRGTWAKALIASCCRAGAAQALRRRCAGASRLPRRGRAVGVFQRKSKPTQSGPESFRARKMIQVDDLQHKDQRR